MTTPVVGCNKPSGSSLQYDLSKVRNVTENASTKGAFEAKILIDVMNELEGKCVNMVAQCKSQYPNFDKSQEKEWITSIDQDNKIVLAHTIENADFPILFNTPRMCDPGITESKNWSLQNYIETRLYLYIYKYKNKNITPRNSSRCSKKYIFDFRPFTFSMSLKGKRIYVNQWIVQSKAKRGFQPKTSFSLKPGPPENVPSSTSIFKLMIQEFQTRKLGKEGTAAFREKGGLSLNLGNKTYDDFINFLKAYDGIGFDGIAPKNGSTIQNINLTDDVLRMLYFDLIHDEVVKKSQKFEVFKERLVDEFRNFKSDVIQVGAPGKTVVGRSYAKFGSILNKTRNNQGQSINSVIVQKTKKKSGGNNNNNNNNNEKTKNATLKQIPALFKTFGDLAQFLYAGKYGTFVASANTKVNSKFIQNGIMNTLNDTAKKVVLELERTKPRIFARTLNSAVVPQLLATNNGKRTVMTQINRINENGITTQLSKNYLNAIIKNRNQTRAQNVKQKALGVKSKLFPNNASATRAGTSISPVKLTNNQQNFINFMSTFRVFTSDQKKTYLNLYNKSTNKNSLRARIKKESYKIKIRNMSGLNNSQKAQYNKAINNAPNNTRLNMINKEARASNNRARRVRQRTGSN